MLPIDEAQVGLTRVSILLRLHVFDLLNRRSHSRNVKMGYLGGLCRMVQLFFVNAVGLAETTQRLWIRWIKFLDF